MSASIHDLSEEGIYQLVFNKPTGEPRSLLDVFTEDEVLSIPAHPKWHCFSLTFQDWVNATIDNIMAGHLKVVRNANSKLE